MYSDPVAGTECFKDIILKQGTTEVVGFANDLKYL